MRDSLVVGSLAAKRAAWVMCHVPGIAQRMLPMVWSISSEAEMTLDFIS
jgi:hypothetical protein